MVTSLKFFSRKTYNHKKHSYWKNKGVPFEKPFPFLGIILNEILTPSQTEELKRYSEHGPIHGFYQGLTPVLCMGDVTLLRDVLVKNFKIFPNKRNIKSGRELFDNGLVALQNEDWKRVRTLITKVSSSNAMKKLVGPFNKSSQVMVQYFKTCIQDGKPINFTKQLTAPLQDVLFSSLCSTKINVYDPGNKFVELSEKLLGIRNWRLILPYFQRIMRLFRISIGNPQTLQFFADITRQIVEERKTTGQTHDDFLQMLMDSVEELNNEEKCEDASKHQEFSNIHDAIRANGSPSKKNLNKRISMVELLANSAFFLSGSSQIQVNLAITAYFLATNEDIQRKAFEDIVDCLRKTKGILTYEAIQEMKYIDNVIAETLRICPLSVSTERKAEANYKLADTGIIIPKGMCISIPIYAIHHDPKYYPDPEKFDPNRFTTEEKSKRNPYAYLPFGIGSRNCVGMRLAPMIMKVFLIHIISCFVIKTCSQTEIPLQFKNSILLLQPKDIFLELEERKNCPLLN